MDETAEVVQITPQEHLLQRTVDQEQINTGETTRNIVGFRSVLEQVKIQEIPEVQVTERIQEQIVPERIEGDIPVPPFVDETVEVVQVIPHEHLHPRELIPEHFNVRIVDLPVPPIVREIPEVMNPSHPAAHAPREQITKQIVNNHMPQITVVPVIDHVSTSHEREQLLPAKQCVHTPHRPDEIVEAAALSVLENVLHEKHCQLDHCVRALKCEQEKLRVLEERGVVPPHEVQSLRSHIQSGKDAMAGAMRDLYEGQQQLKRRRL